MVFSSFTFLFLFLPLTVAFTLPLRNAVLCAFSLVFYAWGEPVYVLLMLGSIVLNYAFGLAMEKWPGRKKAVLAAAVILNLGAIGFFKYMDFLLGTLNLLLPEPLPW